MTVEQSEYLRSIKKTHAARRRSARHPERRAREQGEGYEGAVAVPANRGALNALLGWRWRQRSRSGYPSGTLKADPSNAASKGALLRLFSPRLLT
jgi:hypothetical protein